MRPALFVCLALAGLCLAGPTCPKCGHEAAEGWKFCPVDGALLIQGCPTCSRPVKSDWLYCPYDATALGDAPRVVVPEPAPEEPPGTPGLPGVSSTDEVPLDNLAPDKAIDQWFALVSRGEREQLEALMTPEFLEQLGEEIDLEDYFDKLLRPANRLMFKTSHRKFLRMRIGENRAEFELELIIPERPDDPLRYRFLLEERNGRWFVAGIA